MEMLVNIWQCLSSIVGIVIIIIIFCVFVKRPGAIIPAFLWGVATFLAWSLFAGCGIWLLLKIIIIGFPAFITGVLILRVFGLID